jgi:hypothetical protein
LVTFNETETLLATPVNSPRERAPQVLTPVPDTPQRFVTSVPPTRPPVRVNLTQETSRWRKNDGTSDPALAQMMQMTKMMEAMHTSMAATQAATTQSMQQMAATVIDAVGFLKGHPQGRPSDPPHITKWYAVTRGRTPGVGAYSAMATGSRPWLVRIPDTIAVACARRHLP